MAIVILHQLGVGQIIFLSPQLQVAGVAQLGENIVGGHHRDLPGVCQSPGGHEGKPGLAIFSAEDLLLEQIPLLGGTG